MTKLEGLCNNETFLFLFIIEVSTLRRAVSGEEQNFSGNLNILPRMGRLEKFFREVRSNKVTFSGSSRFFGECRPKFRDDIPDFREDFN